MKNLVTNCQIFFGKEVNSAKTAENFVRKVREGRSNLERFKNLLLSRNANQLYLTGHSLGGVLAHCVGVAMLNLMKEYFVITFENPGIGHYLSHDELKAHATSLQKFFITYVVDPNLINTLHPHIGKIRRLHLKPYNASFISKGMFYKSHVTDCFLNEIIRLMLLLFVLNYLLHLLLGKNGISQFFANTTASLYEQVFDYNLKQNDFFNIAMFLLKYLMIVGKGFTQTYNVTSRQHMIDAIIADFTKGKGKPSYFTEMEQWPNHQQYLLSQVQQHLVNLLHPLKSPGLLTLTKAIELHDHSVKSTYGYKEKVPAPLIK